MRTVGQMDNWINVNMITDKIIWNSTFSPYQLSCILTCACVQLMVALYSHVLCNLLFSFSMNICVKMDVLCLVLLGISGGITLVEERSSL